MITRFNPGIGTAYVGAAAIVLAADHRVDPRVSAAVFGGLDGDGLSDVVAALPHAVSMSFDRDDAAIQVASRGPVVVEVDGRRLATGTNDTNDRRRRHRLLIESESSTSVAAALGRDALTIVGPYRVDTGIVPAAAVQRWFDPLDDAVVPFDVLRYPTDVTADIDDAGLHAGGVAVAPIERTLAALVFSSGERVLLDRPVVLGRNPRPTHDDVSPDVGAPHLVRLRAAGVSRQHAIVRLDGRRFTIDDLGSANGTRVTAPGAGTIAVVPGVPLAVPVGSVVELGHDVSFVVEPVA